jgi:uncharacterized membrane protein YjgN (DUF898 family)
MNDDGREIHFPQIPDVVQPPPVPFAAEIIQDSRFKFHGNASEYFGIWISNLALTIITLGFYAPWAKVRRLRYFYGHTSLANRTFDFTGVPSKILIGRLIAAAVYFLFAFGGQYSTEVAVAGFILLFLVLPWLLRATFRFNARNSKYSNSRLFFSGSNAGMYKMFFLALLLTVLTMGVMFPFALWLYKRYQFEHLHLGQLDFKFDVDVGQYFAAILIPYFAAMGIFVVSAIVIGGVAFGLGQFDFKVLIPVFIALYVGMLAIGPLIQARLYKSTWQHISLADNRFQCDVNQWRFTWIVVTNWIARIFSVGLLSAWAAIRIYRYKVESLSVLLVDQPDTLLTLAQQPPAAFAEELTDILDLDVSL